VSSAMLTQSWREGLKREPDQAANRSFGLIMAGGLGILAIIRSLIDGRVVWWLAAVAAGFALVGFVVPKWLEPIRRSWMKLAAILGAVNSRVLLTVVYVGIVTPIGVLRMESNFDRHGWKFSCSFGELRFV